MILDQFRLDGKVALITGAGQGLGQGMALGLAEAGADIVALDRRDCDETVALVIAARSSVLPAMRRSASGGSRGSAGIDRVRGAPWVAWTFW